MIFFEIEVCAIRKDYAYHKTVVLDAAGCIVKCCSIKLNCRTLADMECFDLGSIVMEIIRYILL